MLRFFRQSANVTASWRPDKQTMMPWAILSSMVARSERAFVNEYADALSAFWNRIKADLSGFRSQYEWPPRNTRDVSLDKRAQLEQRIR